MLTIFIGGNHEASNYLQELPYGGWVAPNIYYLGEWFLSCANNDDDDSTDTCNNVCVGCLDDKVIVKVHVVQ